VLEHVVVENVDVGIMVIFVHIVKKRENKKWKNIKKYWKFFLK
jgi:hypothetical protein